MSMFKLRRFYWVVFLADNSDCYEFLRLSQKKMYTLSLFIIEKQLHSTYVLFFYEKYRYAMAHRLAKYGSKLISMIYHTQNNNFELLIVTILLSPKI